MTDIDSTSEKSVLKVMVIDDNPAVNKEIFDIVNSPRMRGLLRFEGVQFYSGIDAVACENLQEFDVAIIDYDLRSKMDGCGTAISLLRKNPKILCYMLTGKGTDELQATTESMMFEGIKCFHDYIQKPVTFEKISIILHSEQVEIRIRNKKQDEETSVSGDESLLIGKSAVLTKLKNDIRRVANAKDMTVLVIGETGTGKELVAKLIHALTPGRNHKRFMAINCGAISEKLFESEFFGAEPGAAADVRQRMIGKFEAADGGTIVFDEVQSLLPEHQTKLLRTLQERNFQRLGGIKDISFDVRVIALSNENIFLMVEQGTFREDLFYRLFGIPLIIPPLRERKDDIPLLVDHFVKKYKTSKQQIFVSNDLMERICDYEWEGNVRDLELAIERAVKLAENNKLDPGLLFMNVRGWLREKYLSKASQPLEFQTQTDCRDENNPMKTGTELRNSQEGVHPVMNKRQSTAYNYLDQYEKAYIMWERDNKNMTFKWIMLKPYLEEINPGRKINNAQSITNTFTTQTNGGYKEEIVFLFYEYPDRWPNIRQLKTDGFVSC